MLLTSYGVKKGPLSSFSLDFTSFIVEQVKIVSDTFQSVILWVKCLFKSFLAIISH